MMELRCLVAVIRHGDRTPKQKMKMEVRHPKFFELFAKYDGFKDGHVKLKKPKQLQEILDIARSLLVEIEQHKADTEIEEKKGKLEQLKGVLEMYKHFSGINRKVQLKYQPNGWKRRSSSEDGEVGGAPSLVLILKWGGELTPAGRIQAEELGRIFRCMYPGGQERSNWHHDSSSKREYSNTTQGLGLLRLHSTFRHDLKIYASDEGRVQMTAAAFAKGLLALEGELTPILVQMVKSANTNGLLDNDCDSSKHQNIVKTKLHEMLQVDREFTAEDLEKLNPTHSSSIDTALQFIKNPVAMCDKIYALINDLNELLKTKAAEQNKQERKSSHHGDSWELMQRRWSKLEKDFKTKKGQYEISKIPDIYDCVKYDLQHNHHQVLFERAEELYKCSKYMADVVIPQEYGMTKQEKLSIGEGICTPLLKKIRADLQRNIEPDAEDAHGESVNRLHPSYSHGVSSPGRHVRTRLYFTSESHIHSLLTVLRFGGLIDATKDEQWSRAMEYVGSVSELNYLSQIVIMLYEDPTKDPSSENRFHVELHFSPGVNCCVHKNLPPGPGFRPKSKNEPEAGGCSVHIRAPCRVPLSPKLEEEMRRQRHTSRIEEEDMQTSLDSTSLNFAEDGSDDSKEAKDASDKKKNKKYTFHFEACDPKAPSPNGSVRSSCGSERNQSSKNTTSDGNLDKRKSSSESGECENGWNGTKKDTTDSGASSARCYFDLGDDISKSSGDILHDPSSGASSVVSLLSTPAAESEDYRDSDLISLNNLKDLCTSATGNDRRNDPVTDRSGSNNLTSLGNLADLCPSARSSEDVKADDVHPGPTTCTATCSAISCVTPTHAGDSSVSTKLPSNTRAISTDLTGPESTTVAKTSTSDAAVTAHVPSTSQSVVGSTDHVTSTTSNSELGDAVSSTVDAVPSVGVITPSTGSLSNVVQTVVSCGTASVTSHGVAQVIPTATAILKISETIGAVSAVTGTLSEIPENACDTQSALTSPSLACKKTPGIVSSSPKTMPQPEIGSSHHSCPHSSGAEASVNGNTSTAEDVPNMATNDVANENIFSLNGEETNKLSGKVTEEIVDSRCASESKAIASESTSRTPFPTSQPKVSSSQSKDSSSDTTVQDSQNNLPASKLKVPSSQSNVSGSESKVPSAQAMGRASETQVHSSGVALKDSMQSDGKQQDSSKTRTRSGSENKSSACKKTEPMPITSRSLSHSGTFYSRSNSEAAHQTPRTVEQKPALEVLQSDSHARPRSLEADNALPPEHQTNLERVASSSLDSVTDEDGLRRHRHSIPGQLNHYLSFVAGLHQRSLTSGLPPPPPVFSTAVISGSTSAPDLRETFHTIRYVSSIEGQGGVPSIRPLETLHNALSFRQLDEFLRRITRFPRSTLSSSPPKTSPRQQFPHHHHPRLYLGKIASKPADGTPSVPSPSSASSMSWWSGPPSFISSGPPSPYTTALLDSPTHSHPSQQQFFASGSVQQQLDRWLPPSCGPASNVTSRSLAAATIPEGTVVGSYVASETRTKRSLSQPGTIYEHVPGYDDDKHVISNAKRHSCSQTTSSSRAPMLLRKSSTDELPNLKENLESLPVQERYQKEAYLREWMVMQASNSMTGHECMEEVAVNAPECFPIVESPNDSTRLEETARGSLVLSNPQATSPCSPSEGEINEEEEGSESCGSQSHTEIASLIEYPVDSATPDVSLSDAQDGCDAIDPLSSFAGFSPGSVPASSAQ
ncbi:inositol hexakisphosphate and diphosphoinositol-pentakisphosphate kinase isoform X2 [Hyalella azteca]|nr:inositol hexakisphosphate and diphosphoinositol-pentakisphosphate kinase isoform X2 [Hyalella azteca]